MANCILTISIEWVKKDTDLSCCSACEETIYSKINVPAMNANGKIKELDFKFCDSCADIIK